MIVLYTFKGGVKTIVFTDTLQTTFMLVGLIVCAYYILQGMHMNVGDAVTEMKGRGFFHMVESDFHHPKFFLKQILGGMFITIAMTGLDQEMMQKNISVKTLKDSQKNMISFSFILVVVNLIFLFLGGLLFLYKSRFNIPQSDDALFPTIAMQYLPAGISIIFILALISALFPSADGAITALTSSFCIDILGINRNTNLTDQKRMRIRKTVHISFAVIFFICILIFKEMGNTSIINLILDLAGYTYGPLLGLFMFGIFTKRKLRESLVPVVCIIVPLICFLLKLLSETGKPAGSPLQKFVYQFNDSGHNLLGGYNIGIELLIINGLLTYLGLLMISKKGI